MLSSAMELLDEKCIALGNLVVELKDQAAAKMKEATDLETEANKVEHQHTTLRYEIEDIKRRMKSTPVAASLPFDPPAPKEAPESSNGDNQESLYADREKIWQKDALRVVLNIPGLIYNKKLARRALKKFYGPSKRLNLDSIGVMLGTLAREKFLVRIDGRKDQYRLNV